MTLFRLSLFLLVGLFCTIGVAALLKNRPHTTEISKKNILQFPVEVELERTILSAAPAAASVLNLHPTHIQPKAAAPTITQVPTPVAIQKLEPVRAAPVDLPEGNRIQEFFNIKDPKLPIVETVTYRSRISWQSGRPAWLSDYASHYETSRHFIARSLNGKADYLKQEVAEGNQFNVLRQDKKYRFHLVVDTSRCKMWFYYIDLDKNQPTLLATYNVGLGRIDSGKASGLLTPLGNYTLGKRVAIYKPSSMGTYHGKNIPMITVFGTRWIPFEKEIGTCTAPAKGFGVHGTPWTDGDQKKPLENLSSIGKYESDGCIRMTAQDIEELFAIIITKPTQIEIVKDFFDSTIAHAKES